MLNLSPDMIRHGSSSHAADEAANKPGNATSKTKHICFIQTTSIVQRGQTRAFTVFQGHPYGTSLVKSWHIQHQCTKLAYKAIANHLRQHLHTCGQAKKRTCCGAHVMTSYVWSADSRLIHCMLYHRLTNVFAPLMASRSGLSICVAFSCCNMGCTAQMPPSGLESCVPTPRPMASAISLTV